MPLWFSGGGRINLAQGMNFSGTEHATTFALSHRKKVTTSGPGTIQSRGLSMGKSIFLFFCFVMLQLTLCHPAQGTKELKVGVYDNYPMVFVGNDGEVEGFLIDIIEDISSKEKWKIDYVRGSLTDCLERL